mmetsp:Transcript_14082/g.21953  ORF Transcript_14082/g.21953 Transcript_14082/m.21953 type:complete len:95 (-) Transcript_14082:790-1074(-)
MPRNTQVEPTPASVSKENQKQSKEINGFLQFAQKYYSLCQMICFVGIVVCYTVYAHLQEVLFGNQTEKLTISFILCFQFAIAALVSAIIIIVTG